MNSFFDSIRAHFSSSADFSGAKIFSDGESVFVKVLENLGGGNYLVLLNGKRVEAKSYAVLAEGETIRARISAENENGVQKIVLKIENSADKAEFFPRNDDFSEFLEARGFVPDEITKKIVKFLVQSGFEIDRKLVQRARQSALAFSGRENEASQAAAILLEKGIEPTEEKIAEFLQILRGTENPPEKNENQDDAGENSAEESAENDENFLDGIYSEKIRRKNGILTAVNHLKQKNSAAHWIFLPFEWSAAGNFSGLLRILLDTELKTAKKASMTLQGGEKKWFFALEFGGNSVKEVKFFSEPQIPRQEIPSEEKRLAEKLSACTGNSVAAVYSPEAVCDGFSLNQEIPFGRKNFHA
jgi:hypothetical protein